MEDRSTPEHPTSSSTKVGLLVDVNVPERGPVRIPVPVTAALQLLKVGGYQPIALVNPGTRYVPRLLRHLRLLRYQGNVLDASDGDNLKLCAAVVIPCVAKFPAQVAVEIDEFVLSGGGLVVVGYLPARREGKLAVADLLGLPVVERGRFGNTVRILKSHPITDGLPIGQDLGGMLTGACHRGKPDDASIVAVTEAQGKQKFAITARSYGEGRVAHLNWPGPLYWPTSLGNITDSDLVGRCVDWVIANRVSAREEPVVTTLLRGMKRQIPAKCAMLFMDAFDESDLRHWNVTDTNKPKFGSGSSSQPSKWAVDTKKGKLTQRSNIGGHGQGRVFGTNVVTGSEESLMCHSGTPRKLRSVRSDEQLACRS